MIIGGGPKDGPGPISATSSLFPTMLNMGNLDPNKVELKGPVEVAPGLPLIVVMGSSARPCCSSRRERSAGTWVANADMVVLSSGSCVTTGEDCGKRVWTAAVEPNKVEMESRTPAGRFSGTELSGPLALRDDV